MRRCAFVLDSRPAVREPDGVLPVGREDFHHRRLDDGAHRPALSDRRPLRPGPPRVPTTLTSHPDIQRKESYLESAVLEYLKKTGTPDSGPSRRALPVAVGGPPSRGSHRRGLLPRRPVRFPLGTRSPFRGPAFPEGTVDARRSTRRLACPLHCRMPTMIAVHGPAADIARRPHPSDSHSVTKAPEQTRTAPTQIKVHSTPFGAADRSRSCRCDLAANSGDRHRWALNWKTRVLLCRVWSTANVGANAPETRRQTRDGRRQALSSREAVRTVSCSAAR
jgi:hypothetical protein